MLVTPGSERVTVVHNNLLHFCFDDIIITTTLYHSVDGKIILISKKCPVIGGHVTGA